MKRLVPLMLSLVLVLGFASVVSAGGPPPKTTSCGNGDGSVMYPIKLCKPQDFDVMKTWSTLHFVLGNSVTLPTYWTPVIGFEGTLDAKYHWIIGLKAPLIQDNYGTVKNLVLKQAMVSGSGAIAITNHGKISSVRVEGSVQGNYTFVGGIVGVNKGTIEYSSMNGTVGAKAVVGGIAGSNEATGRIINSSVSGSIAAMTNVGGLVAGNSGIIKDSYVWAKVSSPTGYAIGGFAAYNYPTGVITNSRASGNIHVGTIADNVSKFVAINSGKIVNSVGTGRIIIESTW